MFYLHLFSLFAIYFHILVDMWIRGYTKSVNQAAPQLFSKQVLQIAVSKSINWRELRLLAGYSF